MRDRHGFTILELLIALVGASVLAATVIRVYFAQPSVTLENAAVLLARDLRAAQNRSAYLAEPCRFELFANGDGYQVTDLEGNLLVNPRTQRGFERIYSIDGVFRGVVMSEVLAGPDGVLVYDARGLAVDPGRFTLTFQDETRVVHVAKGSGNVLIEGSTSGWVDRGY